MTNIKDRILSNLRLKFNHLSPIFKLTFKTKLSNKKPFKLNNKSLFKIKPRDFFNSYR